MRSNLKAFAIGLLMYLLIYGLKYGYEEALLRPESMASLKRLFFFGSTIFALLLLVVPSYVSGLFVTDRGTMIGLFVAAVGLSARFFLGLYLRNGISLELAILSSWLEQLLVPATIGALSGAAGQLHRMTRN
jgi:hypothetical protein